jgi:hypothetical protein
MKTPDLADVFIYGTKEVLVRVIRNSRWPRNFFPEPDVNEF